MSRKGYFKSEDIAACEKAGLTPHVPKPQRGTAVANGFFRKDEFRIFRLTRARIMRARKAKNARPRKDTSRAPDM
jgi:hypothetical protein